METPAFIPFMGLGLALACLSGCADPAPAGHFVEIGSVEGARAASAGDANGDGHPDLLVSDWDSQSPGQARLYLGSPTGLGREPAWRYDGTEAGAWPQSQVGLAGDLSGNGFPDLYVSAPRLQGRGGVRLFEGGPSGPSRRPFALLMGLTDGEDFGERVAALGDVDGRGGAALAVGAFSFDRQRGRVTVFQGRPGGPPQAVWTAVGESQGDWFGYTLLGPGDLDGDGFADLLTTAKNCDGACLRWLGDDPRFQRAADPSTTTAKAASNQAGKLYLYRGGPAGPAKSPSAVIEGEMPNELFGFALAAAGDLDGDGKSEVAVSSTGWRLGQGRLVLLDAAHWSGGPPRVPRPLWQAEGAAGQRNRWGYTVATLGDLDGNGFLELAVSNFVDSQVQVYWGRAGGYGAFPTLLRGPQAPADRAGAITRFGMQMGALGPIRGKPAFFVTGQARRPGELRPRSKVRIYQWQPQREITALSQ